MPLKCGKSSQENEWGHPKKHTKKSRKLAKKVKSPLAGFDLRTSSMQVQCANYILHYWIQLFKGRDSFDNISKDYPLVELSKLDQRV